MIAFILWSILVLLLSLPPCLIAIAVWRWLDERAASLVCFPVENWLIDQADHRG